MLALQHGPFPVTRLLPSFEVVQFKLFPNSTILGGHFQTPNTMERTSSLPPADCPPRWPLNTSVMGSRSGSEAAVREVGWKLSIACSTVGPVHQAKPGSVGGLTRFWPVGPTAGSHLMEAPLKPQSFRNGSNLSLRNTGGGG